jgi:hypothetical protein
MLGDGQERIDPVVGEGWRRKGTGDKSFRDPGGDGVGDLFAILVS